jgi:hypothetical protein
MSVLGLPRTESARALIAVDSQRLPDAQAIMRAAGAASPASDEQKWRNNGLAFKKLGRINGLAFKKLGGKIGVGLMPEPIPWWSLKLACARAWWWPEAAKALRQHRYHFFVWVFGGDFDPVERRLVLTRITREVVQGSDAAGVYWEDSEVVYEPKAFVEATRSLSSTTIPGTIWIDVRVEPTRGKLVRCFTTGLAPLGFREIEVDDSRMAPDELMHFIGDVASRIVNGRKEIRDGTTIGRSRTEQYKVRFERSMFERDPVMRIEMP